MPINIAAHKHNEDDVVEPLQPSDNAKINFLNSAQNLLKQKQSLPVQMLKEKIMLAHDLELLQKLIDHFNKNFDNTASLATILANNWHQYKNTLCGYTAQPASDVTLFLCDIAEYLATKTGKGAIRFLMPGVSTESISDEISNLDEKGVALKLVLKSHILSESGNYLYPVRMLSKLACESDVDVPNPYFDYDKGPKNEAFIPPLALKQILNHSADTQAIEDAKTHFQSLLQPTNLLGQIHLLIKILRMNGKSGIGSEEFAGARAYEGIISFNHYYQTLNEAQKNAIPQAVKDEIELLINLSSNREKNWDSTENLETCIDTRQAKLAEHLKEHETTLINIGTDEEVKATMLKNAREAFQTRQKQLLDQLAQGTYVGVDKLKITKELVDRLKIPVTLTSEVDLQDFVSLTVSDIQSLLENDAALQDQLLGQLNNLETLIIFTSQAPIEQMDKIIHLVGKRLPKPEASEFSVWLEMLDLKRFEIVLSVFQDSMIITVEDLRLTLQHLSVGKCNALFSVLKNRLSNLIQTAHDVRELLLPLGIEQRAVVFEAIKDRLANLITTSNDIGDVLQFVSAKQRAVVFDAIKDHLPGLIQTPNDVGRVLEYLSAEQRAVVFEAIKDHLPNLIQTANDVGNVLEFLSDEQRTVVFEAIKDRLQGLIQNADDVGRVLWYLGNEQRAVVFKDIKDRLTQLIIRAADVGSVLEFLSIEQCAVVIGVIKDRIPNLIQTADNVGHVFMHLGVEQCTVLIDIIKDRLLNLIKTADDINKVLWVIGVEQRTVVIEAFKDLLPSMIKTTDDIGKILWPLGIQQRTWVIDIIKDCFSNLMQTADDVENVLGILSVEHFAVAFKASKDHLPKLINTADDIGKVLGHFSVEQRAMLIEAIKDRVPKVIKTTDDVGKALQFFSAEQRAVVFEAIKDHLPSLIQTTNDIGRMILYLDIELHAVMIEKMKDRFADLIKTAGDVHDVILHLNVEHCAVVIEAIKDRLPNLITADAVNTKFTNISSDKRTIIITALKEAQAALADFPAVLAAPPPPGLLQNYQRQLLNESQDLDEACLPGSGKRKQDDGTQSSPKKRK